MLQIEPVGQARLLAQPHTPLLVMHRRLAPHAVDAEHRHCPVRVLQTLPAEQSSDDAQGAVHWSVSVLHRKPPQISDGFVEHAGVHTASVVKNWQV